MLPPGSLFIRHPLQYMGQYAQVYKLHVEAVSRETAEKRAKQVDDARKRREYLRAHGMEKPGLFGFGTVEQEEAAKKVKDDKRILEELKRRELEAVGVDEQVIATAPYNDIDGKKRDVKKWFGIW
jgi:hypothetical protein